MEVRTVEDEVAFMNNFVFGDVNIEFIDDCEMCEFVTSDPSLETNGSSSHEFTTTVKDDDDEVVFVETDNPPPPIRLKKLKVRQKEPFTKTKLKKKIMICTICGLKFESTSEILIHMKTHALEDARPVYSCKTCFLKFVTQLELDTHELTHALLSCKECNLIFDSSREHEDHVATHFLLKAGNYDLSLDTVDDLLESPSDPMITIVNPVLPIDIDLPENAVEETGLDTCLCSVCGHKFNKKEHLQQHEEVHMKQRPYECMGCQMSFGRVRTFTDHYRNRRHTGNCRCKLCGMEFNSTLKLIHHVKVEHLNKKTFD